jgi:hypothetical protein
LWLASFRTSRVVVALSTVPVTFVLLAVGNYGAHTTLIRSAASAQQATDPSRKPE